MCSDEDVALSDPSDQGDSEEDRSDDVRPQEPTVTLEKTKALTDFSSFPV